jgi:beta-glucosidase
MRYLRFLAPALLMLAACAPTESNIESQAEQDIPGVIHPERWPETSGGLALDPQMEEKITAIIESMTLEELVAHTIQPDIHTITPEVFKKHRFGGLLNGGNSAPGGNVRCTPQEWLALADEFWEASMDTSEGRKAIPLIWGTDAVHGNSNVLEATIFPHNIGLGCARNPELIREIGAITAKEVIVTGQDWSFAPTLAVPRNDRWGRSYEGYSEDPEIVVQYASALVEGLQGRMGTDEFFADDRVLCSAKHFMGDGGTENGKDQGNNTSPESEFRDIHGAGYPAAIEAGAQNIMGSYNSWHGKKMHGHEPMLTDVLKGQMAFNGFVVGDWNGHGQIAGMENTSSPQALNAGIDMYMAPDSWEGLYHNTVELVRNGDIPQERVEDAVRRILRVKMRMRMFEKPKPSERPYAGDWTLLGGEDHLQVARQAVQESLVLLKNNSGTLPLNPGQKILVAGDGANSIPKQCGGWTLSWQGTGNTNEHFANGNTIWDGVQAMTAAAGGSTELSEDGSYSQKPDVAIVVFGEDPYAEFIGDLENLDFTDNRALEMLQKFQSEGIRTVSVFLSGRPLWLNPEMNASDAFVAAWWPGTQGACMTDLLFADADGNPIKDFKGKLSFSWPKTAVQAEVNRGDEDYDPLFAYGYGLSLSDAENVEVLPEESGLDPNLIDRTIFFTGGAVGGGLTLKAVSGETSVDVVDARTEVESTLLIQAVDRAAQEDARQFNWTGAGAIRFEGESIDFNRQANGDMAIGIQYRLDKAPSGSVKFILEDYQGGKGELDVTSILADSEIGEWSQVDIKLSCWGAVGADLRELKTVFGIETDDAVSISISDLRLVSNEGQAICVE